MIIEFSVANFRSIRDRQTLSMVAGSPGELPQNICEADFDPNIRLVRSAVVYGPNAGGKSNLIHAISFMKQLVLNSSKDSQQGEKILIKSFLFNKKTSKEFSEFEVIFSKKGVRYQYGFLLSEDQIAEEWLSVYPSGRVQQWFSRKYNKKKLEYEWKFSKFFVGKKQIWTTHTRHNALFLSTAVQLNNEQLLPVFNWFQEDLLVISVSEALSEDKSIEQLKTEKRKNEYMRYINIIDPSISDISVEEEEKESSKKMWEQFFLYKDKEMKSRLRFSHLNNVIFELKDQSDGTRKFCLLAGYWMEALHAEKIIVVDELDNSLHPLAARFLVSLIHEVKSKQGFAQLIFSTHNTSLLDSDLFRRDQVWFVEKNKDHATNLYPLLEFSPRKEEAIGKGYLRGRYGALPYIGDWKF